MFHDGISFLLVTPASAEPNDSPNTQEQNDDGRAAKQAGEAGDQVKGWGECSDDDLSVSEAFLGYAHVPQYFEDGSLPFLTDEGTDAGLCLYGHLVAANDQPLDLTLLHSPRKLVGGPDVGGLPEAVGSPRSRQRDYSGHEQEPQEQSQPLSPAGRFSYYQDSHHIAAFSPVPIR